MTLSLKSRLATGRAVLAPGAYDALSALLIEQAGFEAVYVSGASIAYTQLGRPDIGLVGFDQVADVVGRICERVGLPVIVDADTGYGNALNVQRTVRGLERLGAAAIQIEDQTFPKRCGHLVGKSLVSTEEMVGKVKAATDARASDHTLIIARTDSIAVEGLTSALARAEAYLAAGADIIFIEAPQTRAEMAISVSRFEGHCPLVANMVEGGQTPILSLDELSALGFRLVISPGAMVRALIPAAEAFLSSLKTHGTSLSFAEKMIDLAGVNQRIGLENLMNLGAEYDPNSARSRQEG
jgi:2-methylisocitrate lyase-like PEP mutase family enzyme